MHKLLGTILDYFRIGRTGVRLVNDGGKLDVKNAAGNALVPVRVGEAVGATDAVNLGGLEAALATRDTRLDGHDTDIAVAQASAATAATDAAAAAASAATAATDAASAQASAASAATDAAAAQASVTAVQADVATLQGQVAGLSGAGLDRTLALTLGTNATYTANHELPAGAVVKEVKLRVTTAYPAGTEITVGSAGVPSALMGTTDNDPTLAELQEVELWATVPVAFAPQVSISGNPANGAGFVAITYTTPLD